MSKDQKKKILYFVPQFPMLSQTFISREIGKLVEWDNLDISVLSMSRGTGFASQKVLAKTHYQRLSVKICFEALIKYILLRPRKTWQAHRLISGEDSVPYLLQLKRKNFDPAADNSVLKRFHRARLVHFFKGVAFARMFEVYKPEHIHCHFLSDQSTIVMVAAKLLGVPFSVSAHAKDVFVEGSLIPVKAREAKFIVVCNGNTWRKTIEFANLSASSGNVHLLFHGFDYKDAYSKPLSVEKPAITSIFLGGTRFTKKKGIIYMVEASKILRDEGFAHVVNLVGPADDLSTYNEIKDKIKEYGLEETVIIHGDGKGMPNEKVLEFYRISDIFVFPGIETKEGDVDGVPTVLIEAALAKLPIISTDVGSVGDLIDSTNSIIIPQKDVGAIVDGVKKLTADTALSKKLGEAVYIKAEKLFNIDINVRQLEQMLLD